jgi:hypothetical protein
LGLDGKDFDYVHVLEVSTGEQVAVARGHWGIMELPRTIARLHHYYNQAFVGCERQVGLQVSQTLWQQYGITYQYRNRDEQKGGRPATQALGHFRTSDDLAMGLLRRDLAQAADVCPLKLRDAETIRQLQKYQFAPRSRMLLLDQASDAQLKMGAPPGDHDDAVTSLAVLALLMREVQHFADEAPKFRVGTYGHVVQDVIEQVARDEAGIEQPVDPWEQ